MLMDPRVTLMLWAARRSGRSFRPGVSVEAMRRGYAELNRRFGIRDTGGVTVRDVTLAALGETVEARLYRPADATGTLPVLLYFHGGGWTIGSVESYGHLARFFARSAQTAVVSVAYRLAPEHPFPRAHEDGLVALAALERDAAALGVDAARIAVGGDSAGGGIAAAVSAFAEDRGLARPAYQLLIYPSVDPAGAYGSKQRFRGLYPLTPEISAWFGAQYFQQPGDANDPRAAPLRAPHPERLPPTAILAAAHDPLVDEGRAYAERLRAAGVPVDYVVLKTLPHGFVNLARLVPAGERALGRAARQMRAALQATATVPRRTPSYGAHADDRR